MQGARTRLGNRRQHQQNSERHAPLPANLPRPRLLVTLTIVRQVTRHGHRHIAQMSRSWALGHCMARVALSQTLQPEAAAQQGCVPAALRLRQALRLWAVKPLLSNRCPHRRGRMVVAGGFDFSEEVALASCEAGAYSAYFHTQMIIDAEAHGSLRGSQGYLSSMYFSICWAFLCSLIFVDATFILHCGGCPPPPFHSSTASEISFM